MEEEEVIRLLRRLEHKVVGLLTEFGRYANGALGQHTEDIQELEERVNTLENELAALKRREASNVKKT